MSLEAVNTLGSPAVPQRTMQIHRQGLKLHPAFETVRRPGATPDNLVDLFIEIDERLFHCWTITPLAGWKQAEKRLDVVGGGLGSAAVI